MQIYSFELKDANPCEIFSNLAALPYSIFLDSADRAHTDARYSYIAAQPVETIEAKDGVVTINGSGKINGDLFEILQERLGAHKFSITPIQGLPPFQGGAAGLFGYDLAHGIEKLSSSSTRNESQPDMAIGIYDRVIAFDHQENKAWIICHAPDEKTAKEKKDTLLNLNSLSLQGEGRGEGKTKWSSSFTAGEYKAQVQKIIDYIFAGDIFQANLSQKFSAELPENFDAFTHYQHLRLVNAAPFAAFMNLGEIKISSASPERFVTVKNRNVQSKPIKGTIARLSDAAENEKQKQKLQTSAKDRAENIMIVDLLRNDLSKVCEASSIMVEKLCGIESFAKVHHLVSDITGRLKEQYTPLDLLRACFPGGSITGAPKIRAMEIIEELEPVRRGAYCGSLGYISFDGQMDMNILIRTLVYDGNNVSFNVGGGITANSDPADEYQETLDKAQGIFDSFAVKPQRKIA